MRRGTGCQVATGKINPANNIFRNMTQNTDLISWASRRMRLAVAGGFCIVIVASLASPAAAKEPVRPDRVQTLLAKLTLPERYEPRPHCDLRTIKNPHDDRKIYVPPEPVLPLAEIDLERASVGYSDQNCTGHVMRLPPKFPPAFLDGQASGFCKFSYAYAANGRISDIEILNCSNRLLESPTVEAVKRWPPISGECLKERTGERQFSTMRYDLVDEDGNLLPLP